MIHWVFKIQEVWLKTTIQKSTRCTERKVPPSSRYLSVSNRSRIRDQRLLRKNHQYYNHHSVLQTGGVFDTNPSHPEKVTQIQERR